MVIKAYNHELNVRSLRDTIAECSCKKWNYSAPSTDDKTDDLLRSHVILHFAKHLEDVSYGLARSAETVSAVV